MLDDATYNADATNGATFTDPTLTWAGALAAGDTITITYSVTVNDPATGDDVITNAVVPTAPGGECIGTCSTTTGVQSYSVTKAASSASAEPGSTITYTVTVENTGSVDYTAAEPASFDDDLTAVLDDATFNDDATNGATFADPTLSWSGALAAGETVAVTYSVTVNDPNTGDGTITNAVVPTAPGGECEGECSTTTGVQSYTVTKDASATSVNPGDSITYTVTVTNTGTVDYTAAAPASFEDDLTAVLDDATYNADATGGATYDEPTLSWAGALAAGDTVTVTYSVTVNDPNTGDDVITNAVVPTSPGGSCEGTCSTTTGVQSYSVTKSASTATAVPGSTIIYTVTIENTGSVDYTAADPASFDDDLSAVNDDATYNDDATGGATYDEPTLTWAGALAAGDTVTVTYSVTVNDPNTGDGVITNAVVPTSPGGECEGTCSTTTGVQSYTVTKAASATSVVPGDTITYVVTVENTGTVDYTAADPASFDDDLSAVLDDATYNDDATAGVTFSSPTLSWAGTLTAGDTVTVIYSVTVNDPNTGDDVITNAVVPTGPGGSCEGTCSTTTGVQSYTVAKSASTATAVPGAPISYTVTVTNTGTVDYTAAAPASFDDDLSAVLDDATYNGDATGGATFADPTLSWAGALAAGEVVTITYSVTVNDPATDDDVITNTVVPTAPGGECDGECSTTTGVQSYTVTKEASATSVIPGGTLTYTVTVTNTGTVDYTAADPASFDDDLSAVLDDATYNGDATGGATYDEPTLSWAGALAAGDSIEITYSVTVSDPNTGDDVITNAVVPTAPGGECEGACSTTTGVQSYTVTKTASTATAVPGSTITYTVTVENIGTVDYTAAAPASFDDDLSAVLDDATFNDDATGGATFDEPTLSWAGALAAGEVVTITYSVTVNDPNTGDDVITNAVVPTAPGGDCIGECTTTTGVQSYTVSKAASSAAAVPGSTITYTVTVTNTGTVDYTAADAASFEDDLSAVLDDAAYNGDATNGATYTAPTLAWSGALAAGESIDITYTVTVNDPDTGDDVITNAVVPTAPGGACEGDCSTTTDVQSYTVAKSASVETVQLGGTVTYTVTVTNTGGVDYTAAAPASFTDDLSAVLDDASYNDDATNGATVTGSTLAWSGALAAGESIDITYSVTVNSPNTGDNVLTNTVSPSGPGGSCTDECATTTPVQSFAVTKTADTTEVIAGDTITYTLTIVNTGQAPYTADAPAALTDDLSDVIDDAEYNGDATNGAVYDEPQLSWSGPLEIGETVTVTYSVIVDDPPAGDRLIDNSVVTENGGNCGPGSTDAACVENILAASYVVSKQASDPTAMAGDVVTYTVTVTNTGAVDYTAADPASFDDNLANVLDDATYNDDATGGATVTGTTLSWAGPLAVGASIEITYSVTVDAAGAGAGDLALGNIVTATAPGGECELEAACTTRTPVGQFEVSKESSGEGVVNEGDIVTYTITVTNDSEVDFTDADPASFDDDLSAVLDDAVYNDDATEGATVTGTTLSWQGPIDAGAAVTITYTVTVTAAGTGDGILTNGVVPGGGGVCIENCSTEDALQAYTASKTSSGGGSVIAGDVITYTLTIVNTGAVAYPEDAPASVSDDLSAVLDDAFYNDDATQGAVVDASTLTWSGELAVGATIEVTYSVTVLPAGAGDGVLTNAVLAEGPGGGCDPDADCSTTDVLSAFSVEKTASSTVVNRDDTLTYTILVTNTGAGAFTEDAPAVITDDLSQVLDDATYNDDASNGATYTAPVLSWSLAIPVGESVAVTYTVTVDPDADGDLVLANEVVPGDGGECGIPMGRAAEGPCVTETPIAGYTVVKSVDTASTGLGDTVTYTITVINSGAVDYTDENPATFTDDLSDVLDDAVYNADATGGATYDAPVIAWSGAVEVGGYASVTYSLTVNDAVSGDRELVNTVIPGEGATCDRFCSVTTEVDVPGLPPVNPPLALTGLNPWILGGGLGVAALAILAGAVLLTVRRRQGTEAR